MNEWGVPDWRDASAYGETEGWDFHRWRWEFYRRRGDLREYFDSHAKETYEHNKQFAGRPGFPVAHRKPHEPGFGCIVDVQARETFGYSPLPNPRIGDQPSMVLLPYKGDGVGNIIDGDWTGGCVGNLLDVADVWPAPIGWSGFILSA